MSKHTPGPWFSERDQIGPRSQGDDQSYGMLMPVAYVERFGNPERAEGNKALIAAAPELLEALEYIIKEGQVFTSAIEGDSHSTDFEAWAVRARAAIAKAKGLAP